jgi:hypothetical protein
MHRWRNFLQDRSGSALNLANPVSIVMGLYIQAPSVVEDAQCLYSRALEWAASTPSQQANGTVAHSISHDIWSTDIDGGVHQALLDQWGCWSKLEMHKDETDGNSTPATTNRGSLASALLGALDEDLGGPSSASPPFICGSIVWQLSSGIACRRWLKQQQQMRLVMQLCQWNGIHSASIACISLSESIDDEANDEAAKTSSMIQLAREELARFANSYQVLLANRIVEEIHEYCGSLEGVDFEEEKCIHHLRHFFLSETYDLNESTFQLPKPMSVLSASWLYLSRSHVLLRIYPNVIQKSPFCYAK